MIKELQEILNDDTRLTQISKLIIEKLDINRKGYLNKSEIKEFFEDIAEELETQISQNELEEIFLEIDENSTMKITHEEIKSLIRQLLGYLVTDAVGEF